MSNQFNVGNTVRLKSGSPLMTITGIGDKLNPDTIYCTWFYDKKMESGNFPAKALILEGEDIFD